MNECEKYRDFVESVAFYPHCGERSIDSLVYPVLGLSGETSELFEKVWQGDLDKVSSDDARDGVLKEAGDVLWYVVRICTEAGIDVTNLYRSAQAFDVHRDGFVKNYFLSLMVITAGEISEKFKKALRDGGGSLPEDYADFIRGKLKVILISMSVFASFYDATLKDIAAMNVEKLISRRDRGVLSGEGDNR